MKKTLLIIGLLLLGSNFLHANSLGISNPVLENYDESQGFVDIKFNITWQNSWRLNSGPSNWDAAWVFVKYRANSGPWQHATLYSVFSSSTAYNFDLSADQKGGFFYRATEGSGQVTINNNKLKWDYANDGVSINDTIEIKVFGIEMVYVPEGGFYLGSNGGTEVDGFRRGNFSSAYEVTSEDEITVGPNYTDLYYTTTGSYTGDQLGPIPVAFPKGYQGFYCMKYEISEEQYVEFFNTLSPDTQLDRDITNSSGKNSDDVVNRNTVSWLGVGTEATTLVPDRACSFLSNSDLELYLVWACLRPMTEFEFEKAARGPGFPLQEAYAWGTTSINATPHQLAATDSPIEYIFTLTSNIGNASYAVTDDVLDGPLRCGIFAYPYPVNILKTREDSGSSYYGIMELSGNLGERIVTVGSVNHRAFNGNHGQGNLGSVVQGNVNFVNLLANTRRGGNWNEDASLLRISDRTFSGGPTGSGRRNHTGGRGVRTID